MRPLSLGAKGLEVSHGGTVSSQSRTRVDAGTQATTHRTALFSRRRLGSTPGGAETRFQGANGPGTTQGLGTEAWRGVASSSTAWLDRIGCSKQHPWPTLLLCLLRNSDNRKGDCRHRSCMSLSYETHSAQPGPAWTCQPRTRRSSRCPGGCGALFLTVHCYFVGSRARPCVGSGRRHGEGRARPFFVRHSRWATAVVPWDPKP